MSFKIFHMTQNNIYIQNISTVLLLCCFMFNSNRLGFRLCVYVEYLFSTYLVFFQFIKVLVVSLNLIFQNNPNRLGPKLYVCEGNPFSTVLFLFNLHDFFGNLLRFKFLEVFLLQIVLFIIELCGIHWLHLLVPSTFLISY
jgi:hypothetical protein